MTIYWSDKEVKDCIIHTTNGVIKASEYHKPFLDVWSAKIGWDEKANTPDMAMLRVVPKGADAHGTEYALYDIRIPYHSITRMEIQFHQGMKHRTEDVSRGGD